MVHQSKSNTQILPEEKVNKSYLHNRERLEVAHPPRRLSADAPNVTPPLLLVAKNESSEVIDILLPVTFYFNSSTRLDNVKTL